VISEAAAHGSPSPLRLTCVVSYVSWPWRGAAVRRCKGWRHFFTQGTSPQIQSRSNGSYDRCNQLKGELKMRGTALVDKFLVLIFGTALALSAGCGSGSSCNGSSNCPCFGNGTCNAGLMCSAGTCVYSGPTSTGTGTTTNQCGSINAQCASIATDTCGTCLAECCCTQLVACANNTSCAAIASCGASCTTTACESTCESNYPAGQTAATNYLNCGTSYCMSACGS
jgi:hypothetical protein